MDDGSFILQPARFKACQFCGAPEDSCLLIRVTPDLFVCRTCLQLMAAEAEKVPAEQTGIVYFDAGKKVMV